MKVVIAGRDPAIQPFVDARNILGFQTAHGVTNGNPRTGHDKEGPSVWAGAARARSART
jgi:hypothetical protein